MEIKIPLEKNKNKKSVNKDFYQPLNFERSSMVIPVSDISENINTYKVFEDERNTSTKYRLNVTLNPLMSNVLLNKVSEIKRISNNEILTGQERLNAIQKIDDTLYDYKLGYDIFDNNFTRFNTFRTGNTLNDFTGSTMFDLVTIQDAIINNIQDNNGWVCLSNKTKINNNKMFPNRKPCEKIDLFPTRDYLLFKPVYVNNSLKDNWDYSLTYPYENYVDNLLVKSNTGINGIPISSGSTVDYNGIKYLQITTAYKHGLTIGDVIKIKGDALNNDRSYLVYDIGDINKENEEYVFFLDANKYSDLLVITNITSKRIVRVINGVDSNYYIRKFRKLPNLTDDTELINEHNIESKILTGSTDFLNEAYHPGFSRNIFNDSLYQIQYIDDIDTNLIKDNLGRPLSEIFFTVIKKNINDGNYEPANIFTKIVSGIDSLPGTTGYANIRIINNIDTTEEPLETNITTTGGTIYDGSILEKNSFFGDIVEYNISTVKEIKLDDIYHRFNTIKRETHNDFIFSDIFGDETNILLNSGFLDGIKYWNVENAGISGVSILNTTTTGSTKMLKITTATVGGSGVWNNNYNSLRLNSGETYTISFDAKTTTPFTLSTVGIEDMYTTSIVLTTTWTRYTFTFIATDYDVHSFLFYKSNGGDPKEYYVSNVKIENNSTSTLWSTNPDDDINGIYKFVSKTIQIDPTKEGYMYKPHYSIQIKNHSSIISQGEIPEITNCNDFMSGMTFDNEIVLLQEHVDGDIKNIILKLDSLEGYANLDTIRITKNSDLSYINLKINISSKLKNSIIFPYDSVFMPGVSSLSINNYVIRKYNEWEVPLYSQDQYNGTCLWRETLKEGIFDGESTRNKELTFTNGRLYLSEFFNFYLKRQDPFGEYGLRDSNFPSDLFGNDITQNIINNKIRKTNQLC